VKFTCDSSSLLIISELTQVMSLISNRLQLTEGNLLLIRVR